MDYSFIKKFVIISFISIIVTRLIPHPPNFTSSIAIAFYLPFLFGTKFILVAVLAFIIGDLIIGMHYLVPFTWGSLLLIGLLPKFFSNSRHRLFGITLSCLIFFIISNFGVWIFSDFYTNDIKGLIACYTLALPFLHNSIIGSLLFSILIELTLILNFTKTFVKRINPSLNI